MKPFKINDRIAVIVLCTFLTGMLAYMSMAFFDAINPWGPFIIIFVGTLISLLLTRSIKKHADNYIRDAAAAVGEISEGKLTEPAVFGERDELAAAIAALAQDLSKFTDAISKTAAKQADGNSFALLDEKTAEGAFKDALKSLNASYSAFAKDLENIEATLLDILEGNPRGSVSGLAGDRAKIGEAADAIAGSLKALTNEILNVKQAFADGRLSYRTETANLNGAWARSASALGEMLTAAAAPLDALRGVHERLARGDYSPVSERNFKGEYGFLFQKLGQAADAVTAHNKELLAIFGEIAGYIPSRGFRREYNGIFPAFKQAVNEAAEKLTKLTYAETSTEKRIASPFKPAGVTLPAVPRPVKSDLPVRSASATPAKGGTFTPASPVLGHRALVAPSAAKVYDAKDFGKY